MSKSKILSLDVLSRLGLIGIVGTGLWIIPAPVGLSEQGWHLFIVFLCTLGGIILKPLPMGAISLIGLIGAWLTRVITVPEGLAGFSSDVSWLVLGAFFVARGFIKTGLGARIAFLFMRVLGGNSLGLGYGLVMTDFLLSPATPSNTARGAGIVFPLVQSIAQEYGSTPHDGPRKIGAYLISVAYHSNVITSGMFITAFAGNPVIVKMAEDLGVSISWGTWAIATIVPGLLTLSILPWYLFKIYPPLLKSTPHAPSIAQEKLNQMGPLSTAETIMLGVFLLLLSLWMAGGLLDLKASVTALIGVVILLTTGVLEWDDIISEKGAWDVFVWLSVLVTLAGALTTLGVTAWVGESVQSIVAPWPQEIAFTALSLLYFYSRYFFASGTAQISSVYSLFVVAMIGSGTPPFIAALWIGVLTSLAACLTHFATGTAPVYFGAGYISLKKWWTNGFFISLLSLSIWSTVGLGWWYILGFWE